MRPFLRANMPAPDYGVGCEYRGKSVRPLQIIYAVEAIPARKIKRLHRQDIKQGRTAMLLSGPVPVGAERIRVLETAVKLYVAGLAHRHVLGRVEISL